MSVLIIQHVLVLYKFTKVSEHSVNSNSYSERLSSNEELFYERVNRGAAAMDTMRTMMCFSIFTFKHINVS